jgi:ketosteroid isomerase-like protein
MRHLLLGLTVCAATADRASERDALLSADRMLSDRTSRLGVMQGFLPALTDGAAYLHPGAPLLRGTNQIRAFLETRDSVLTWVPAFADVSVDGVLGYSYGWIRSAGTRGKYLACWQKTGSTWRIVAYTRTTPVPVSDTSSTLSRTRALSRRVRGRADPAELMHVDSAFAALSVTQGAKAAFLAFAASDAMAFGGGTQMNEGRDAIGASFDGFPSGAVLEWWPVAAAIAESGDLGCTVGEAKIASLNHYSKYLTIWKRQPDGTWKFVADGGNVRPAPAPSGTPPPED